MAVAAAMAAMPVVAAGAGPSSGSDTGSSSSSTSTGSTITAGTGSAVSATNQPSVVVTESGAKVSLESTTTDTYGCTAGLMGESAGNGTVKSGEAFVSVATGEAENDGLDAVNPTANNTINALNSGADINTVLPALNLGGYKAVSNTRALVSKNAAGVDVPATVEMYVSSLPANVSEVVVVCLDYSTGQWINLPAQVDPVTKKVTFKVPGSCTIQFRAK